MAVYHFWSLLIDNDKAVNTGSILEGSFTITDPAKKPPSCAPTLNRGVY